jgi:hypothetical protein
MAAWGVRISVSGPRRAAAATPCGAWRETPTCDTTVLGAPAPISQAASPPTALRPLMATTDPVVTYGQPPDLVVLFALRTDTTTSEPLDVTRTARRCCATSPSFGARAISLAASSPSLTYALSRSPSPRPAATSRHRRRDRGARGHLGPGALRVGGSLVEASVPVGLVCGALWARLHLYPPRNPGGS